jgi:hypothetical protein
MFGGKINKKSVHGLLLLLLLLLLSAMGNSKRSDINTSSRNVAFREEDLHEVFF